MAALKELRQQHLAAAERLAELRAGWQEQKTRVTAALDDLEERVRETTKDPTEENHD